MSITGSQQSPCLLLSLVLCLFPVAWAAAGHEHLDHHEDVFEWGGIFELPKDEYTWYAVRSSNGSYADENASFVVLNASSVEADLAGLAEMREDAEAVGSQATISLQSGSQLQLNSSLTLQFDASAWISLYKLEIVDHMRIAVFMQHVPTEFENGFHYFKSASGEDLEPLVAQALHEEALVIPPTTQSVVSHNRWGLAIGAAFVTTSPALLAVVWAVPFFQQVLVRMLTPMFGFASGAIFGAAVFLLMPEALHLVGEGQEEAYAAGTWGACILGGWFMCFSVHLALSRFKSVEEAEEVDNGKETALETGETATTSVDQPLLSLKSKIRIAFPILMGDLFHNFSDGLVIGVAAKGCSHSFVWKIVGISIAHETPQEMADCIVLINKAGLHWSTAAVVNWLSSASTVLGAAIAYGADVSVFANGCILAFGAGTYLFVAITELGHRLTKPGPAVELLARGLLFVVGATALGVILLGHQHCAVAAEGELLTAGSNPSQSHNH